MLIPVRLAIGLYLKWRERCWSRRKIAKHHEKRLRMLLKFVRKNSPYYRDLIPEGAILSLDRVPTISKTCMKESFDRLNTEGLAWDDLVDFAISREKSRSTELYRGEYSLGLSSGTSGNKLITVLSSRERERYSALLWARGGIHFRGPKRILFALRVNNPSFMEVRKLGLTMVYVDYTHDVVDLVTLINDKRLNTLAGPPSLMRMLAARAGDIVLPIRTVICYAEILTPEDKRLLEESFRCPVSQIYQGAEGFLGFTCSHGSLHLNEDVSYVELHDAGDPDHRVKRVVVTDLYRRVQPFIRYELNDLLEIDGAPCSCGSSFRRIVRIHGRQDDIFLLNRIGGGTGYLFPDYVRRSITQASDSILNYQAIQESRDRITVRLVVDEKADLDRLQQSILANLRSWTERIDSILPETSFEYGPARPHPESGKTIRVWRRFQ